MKPTKTVRVAKRVHVLTIQTTILVSTSILSDVIGSPETPAL
jgi:hypothetical protein